MVKRNPRAAVTVGIYRDLYDTFRDQARPNGTKELINTILTTSIANHEFVKRHFRDFEKTGVSLGTMFVKDIKKGIVAGVIMDGDRLFCKGCWIHNCNHVLFALAQPDLFELERNQHPD